MVSDQATVLRLITRLNIGGPARQALLLSKALRDTYETVLAAGHASADEGELSDPEVDVVRLPLVRPLAPMTDARAILATRALVRHTRPAIVHTHMAKAGAVGRLIARTARPRPVTIHTFHGHVLDGYFRPAVAKAFIAAERRLARSTDLLIAVSEQTRDDLLDLGVGTPDRFRVVHLGLDLDRHRTITGRTGAVRAELGLPAETIVIGTIGRLAPIKNHELLLHAVARLDDVHLAVVGDGERRGTLAALADSLGVSNRVHWLGWRLDMPATLADLDLVVCSSNNEGTPVALIEAGSAGVAVVTTDVGGVRTVVEHGTNGLVVPAGDPAALAEAIGSLAGDPARRAAMGDAGRAGSARFDQQRLVDEIRALYADLL